MTIRASLTLRWSRASLLGLVVLSAGMVAHMSASGLLPGPGQMAALYSIVVLGCAAFLGREATTWRLGALMVGGQGFVHTGLAATAGHHDDTGTAPSHLDHAGQHAANEHSPEIVLPEWLPHAVTDVTAHPVMALAHVLAAAAVAAWLAVGERALWAVIRIASGSALHLARAMHLHLYGLTTILLARIQRLPKPETYLEPLPQLPVWSRGAVLRGPPQVLLGR